MAPKRSSLFLAACLFAQPAAAQMTSAGVTWQLHVHDLLGDHSVAIAYAGGTLPNTGLTACVQRPIRNFTDSLGNRQQEIRVTCSVGIGSKVTLTESCYTAQADRSFGAMTVEDGINNFAISLSCSR